MCKRPFPFRFNPRVPVCLLLTLLVSGQTVRGQSPTVLKPFDTQNPQYRELQLSSWPENDQAKLAGPLPSIIKVWLKEENQRTPLEFGFNVDATEVIVFLPQRPTQASAADAAPPKLEFLVTENTTAHPDGVVVLSALDSNVIGNQAKLETHPGSHRIGYWLRQEDFVQWRNAIPAGSYHVELIYSRAFETGTEVELRFDEEAIALTLAKTGSWYRYRTVPVGNVKIDNKELHQIEVRVKKIVNNGVMNLKAIVLTPVPAGEE